MKNMQNKLFVSFSSDEESDNQQKGKTLKNHQAQQNDVKKQKYTKNVQQNIEKKQKSLGSGEQLKKKDKFISNKISANNYFKESHNEQVYLQDDSINTRQKKQLTKQAPTIQRRRKMNSEIKLLPLKSYNLIKKSSEPIQQIQSNQYNQNNQSSRSSSNLRSLSQSSMSQNTITRPKAHLNFNVSSSSSSQEDQAPSIQQNQNLNFFKKASQYQKINHVQQTVYNEISNGQDLLFLEESQNDDIDYQIDHLKSQTTKQQKNLKQQKRVKQQNQVNKQANYVNKQGKQRQLNPQKRQQQKKGQVSTIKLREFLLCPTIQSSILSLRVCRDKSLLNFFSPEFNVCFQQDNYFLMCAKRTSIKPYSNFMMSSVRQRFQENTSSYIGKMKSNLTGSLLNVYGPGLNPGLAQTLNAQPREIIATIVFKTEIFGTGKPREFTVFLKNHNFNYYQHLQGVTMYKQEIPLNQLYAKVSNQDKITVFQTRKPTFNNQTKQFTLNFQGKVKFASIKNFILEEQNRKGKNSMIFGKINENQYCLDIYHPFPPVIGLAIALTAFDTRIGSD